MKHTVLTVALVGAFLRTNRQRNEDYEYVLDRIDKLESTQRTTDKYVDTLYTNEETTVNALEYLAGRIGSIEDLLGLQ